VNAAQHDKRGNFLGFVDLEQHLTVGDHRAWCHTCREWCYPRIACTHCEAAPLPEGGS
jgi:hypothetical protein